jgi:hypothetical protein
LAKQLLCDQSGRPLADWACLDSLQTDGSGVVDLGDFRQWWTHDQCAREQLFSSYIESLARSFAPGLNQHDHDFHMLTIIMQTLAKPKLDVEDMELVQCFLRESGISKEGEYSDERLAATIFATNDSGCTLVWLAAESGHVAIIDLLCGHETWEKAGQKPKQWSSWKDQPNSRGNTPVHIACQNGHAAAVQELVKSGASVASCNRGGRTPLQIAILADGKFGLNANAAEVVKVLVQQGAPVDDETWPGAGSHFP